MGGLIAGPLAMPLTAAAAPMAHRRIEASATASQTINLPNLPLLNSVGATAGTLTGGVLNVQSFVNQNGVPTLVGTLSGTLTNAAGAVVGTLTNLPVNLPLQGAAANQACTILDLTVGPIDLNLLGLMVHTNTIHLTITAQPGAGNLLGNLLCGVAHLLDNTNASANAIANFLNRILNLGGILGLA
jgi:hypothetical protein